MTDVNEQGSESVDSGKYRLLVRLGRGGMAEVYVAVARGPAGFNKLVVVKRLLPSLAEDEGFREMFMQEARLAARLNHPNVVATHEVGEAEDGMVLAMEYLEGQPLSRLVRALTAEEKRLHPTTCIRIACDMLAGLHHAHELKDFDGTPLRVVHRDVSPQNVFVTYQGQVKVLDFGIAKAERTSTKTQPGWLKGKYAYMAPEQFLAGDVDRRVDVFTTATVLWELLAGRPRRGGGSEAQTVKRLVSEPIPRLSEVLDDIDPAIDAIVARGLEREPDARFASALEMKLALEEVLSRTGMHEDLARVVGTTFAAARREVEDVISRQLGDSARLSTLGTSEPPGSGTYRATIAAHLPTSPGSLSIHAGVAHTTGPGPLDADARSPGRGRFGVAGAIAAGAALVFGTILVARAVSGPSTSTATVAEGGVTRPAIAAASLGSTDAPLAPSEPTAARIAVAAAEAPPSAEGAQAGEASAGTSGAGAGAARPTVRPAFVHAPAPAAPRPVTVAAKTAGAAPVSAPPAPAPVVSAAAPPHEEQVARRAPPAPVPPTTSTAPEGRRFRTTL